MLADITLHLPRFLFYQHILPTSRMAEISSELYTAILDFLCSTIIFFRQRRIRKSNAAIPFPATTNSHANDVSRKGDTSVLFGLHWSCNSREQSVKFRHFAAALNVMLRQWV